MAALLLAVPSLRGVSRQLSHMQPWWVAAAVALELASCVSFVVVFRLFFDRVPAATARELAWTEQGSGALLAGGGVGGLVVGGWLLHDAGMPSETIVERSSGLFFLTSGANVAALIGAGALLLMPAGSGPHDLLRAGGPILLGAGAIAGALLVPVAWRRACRASKRRGIHRRPKPWLDALIGGIGGAEQVLVRPTWRVLGAAGYLGFDIAALWATLAAAGQPMPAAPLVLGYVLGYLANSVPIPASVGVLEGGLAGALIAYGASPAQAGAAVVLYHAIAFWIPAVGGLLAFGLLRRSSTPRRQRAATSCTVPVNPTEVLI
jgi:uncharacterized membrane protein YbhN (UPF0104 family)